MNQSLYISFQSRKWFVVFAQILGMMLIYVLQHRHFLFQLLYVN